ncbi:hypothetical protein QQP08_011476 [Theobroma cacao]|nr:hypothetical protein QQP08_011476 [Theobroma cacao]
MAATPNQRPSPNDLQNLFRKVNDSKKIHSQEPLDEEFANTERRQWRVQVSMGLEANDGRRPFSISSLFKSCETKIRGDLKAMMGICIAGLVTDEGYSMATKFIYSDMDAEMKRGGGVQDEDKTEKKHLQNELGSNLEFWFFYACI